MSGYSEIADGDRIAAASEGFRALWTSALATAFDTKLVEQLATRVDSNSSQETHAWIRATPSLVEWVGARVVAGLAASSFTIVNRRYQSTIRVAETDFADDKLGIIGKQVEQMAQRAAAHYTQLLVELMINGFTNVGYDGQPFFSATHVDGDSAAQSNLLTATLDDTGAYDLAFQRMLEVKDEHGEPSGATPTLLVCGPAYRARALEIVKAERDANGASNINANSAELYVSPRLVGAHAAKWFLFDLSKPIRPFILQVRQPLTFVPMTNPDSESRFFQGQYFFGVEGRHNVGYSLWQYAVGSNGTA